MMQAFKEEYFCASKPVIIPVSTSPAPAVAIPALPVELKYPFPSGVAIKVWWPFNTIKILSSFAFFRAMSILSKSFSDFPNNLSNSLGCGVIILCAGIDLYNAGYELKTFKASASITTGFCRIFENFL